MGDQFAPAYDAVPFLPSLPSLPSTPFVPSLPAGPVAPGWPAFPSLACTPADRSTLCTEPSLICFEPIKPEAWAPAVALAAMAMAVTDTRATDLRLGFFTGLLLKDEGMVGGTPQVRRCPLV